MKYNYSENKKASHPVPEATTIEPRFKTGLPGAVRGSVLIEATVALVVLSVASLMVLKGTMNILAPRQWTMVQNVSDAYLTYEKAYAQRVPFDTLTAVSSPWPVYPAKSETAVTLGILPGGRTLNANVIRTRIPDANNFPAYGGTGTTSTTSIVVG